MKTYKQLITEDVDFEKERALAKSKIKINNALIKSQLDGNGRFPTLAAIQSKVDTILNPFGYSVDWEPMMSVDNTGHLACPILAFSAGVGNGSAYTIRDRKLSIQWELRNPTDSSPKQWAAVCYVS